MRGSSKLAAVMVVAICLGALAFVLPGGAGAAKGKGKGVVPLGTRQTKLLKHGLRVRLPAKHPKGMKVRATSSTFDDPAPVPLTKVGHARKHKRIVRLPLTRAGKAAVASCEARTIQVRAGKRTGTAALVRNTPACSPKPIDLSRASDCDFIGQQQGSLCLLPFPDDYNTVADPSTATGRRIDLHAGGMPKNASASRSTPPPTT